MKKINFLIKMLLTAMICGTMIVSCGGEKSGSGGKDATTKSASKSAEDQMLDEFEKFVDEYVKFSKAMMAGDAAAIAKAGQMTSQYEELMQKITAADEAGKFTEAQKARGTKISEKMVEAFQ